MTVLLTRSDVQALLGADDCYAAVLEAFRQLGDGRAQTPGVLGVPSVRGGFHIKAGLMKLERDYFAAKINGNFIDSVPRIKGVIVLSDARDGTPLAIIDSMELTRLRTAAATAIAAHLLANEDADTATICGCGEQAPAQLAALMRVRKLERVFAYDVDRTRADAFAAKNAGVNIDVVDDLSRAVRASAIVVTCTPSKTPLIFREHVAPGAFVAGVGADSEDKNELDAALFSSSTVVCDLADQCARIGDLHHAIARGAMTREDVHADLGAIVAGKARGRVSREEIIVFDSTGMALQDVAAAAIVYERALAASRGMALNFSS